MVSDSAVLMSIRPKYAEAILDGTKTVELRRRRPSFAEGTTVVVYSSSPDQFVSGIFRTGRVLQAPPRELWRLVAPRAGVTRTAFDAYFEGLDTAYAIEIHDAERLPPTPLSIRPPQSYLLLHYEDARHRPVLLLAQKAADTRPTRIWLPLRLAAGASDAAIALALRLVAGRGPDNAAAAAPASS